MGIASLPDIDAFGMMEFWNTGIMGFDTLKLRVNGKIGFSVFYKIDNIL